MDRDELGSQRSERKNAKKEGFRSKFTNWFQNGWNHDTKSKDSKQQSSTKALFKPAIMSNTLNNN